MLRLFSLLALLGVASLAHAADNGIYLGVGVVQSEYDLDNPLDAEPFDDKDNGYKLIAGWRPLDSFGVEANYIDHGEATGLEAKTVSVFAVGYLDFPLIDLFAKAGATSWEFDGSTPAFPDFDFDESGVDFAWGVGVQARFGSLGARLEYERFRIIEDQELGTISLSLTYTFL